MSLPRAAAEDSGRLMAIEEKIEHRAVLPAAPFSPCRTAARIRLEPARTWPSLELAQLWEHHELIYFFIWRDIKVRYRQTVLGAGWAIIQPLFTMLIFTLFFGRLAKVPSDGIPYSLFAFCGLVPWSFFAYGLNQGSTSLVSNSNLVKKVYFPRLTIPIAKVVSALVDFGLAFLLLIGMMFYYGSHPTLRVLYVPLFSLLAMVCALGVAFWLSALNVHLRDVGYTLPFLTQLWLFATPIAYPSSLLPRHWQVVYGINPMVGVVEGFRWALLGTKMVAGPVLVVSVLVAVAILVSGAFWFRRLERTFADVL